MGLQHGADGLDGGVEAVCDFAIGALEGFRVCGRGIEVGGELRTVGAERVQLRDDRLALAIGLVAPLDRTLQRVKRQHQAFGGRVDCTHAHCQQSSFLDRFGFRQMSRVGKRLGEEAYVLWRLAVNIDGIFSPALCMASGLEARFLDSASLRARRSYAINPGLS